MLEHRMQMSPCLATQCLLPTQGVITVFLVLLSIKDHTMGQRRECLNGQRVRLAISMHAALLALDVTWSEPLVSCQ